MEFALDNHNLKSLEDSLITRTTIIIKPPSIKKKSFIFDRRSHQNKRTKLNYFSSPVNLMNVILLDYYKIMLV